MKYGAVLKIILFLSAVPAFCIDRLDDTLYFKYAPFIGHHAGGEPDGNTLLYHGTYLLILKKLGLITDADVGQFKAAVNASWLSPGFLKRGFYKNDPQSHDDYIGVVAASGFYYQEAAQAIAQYGLVHGWTWIDPRYPERVFEPTFYRFPSFVPHLKVSAGYELNYLDQLLWSVDLVINAFSSKTEFSGKILSWCEVQAMSHKYFITDLAISFWENRIVKSYEHGMGEVFAAYFSPDHIFAKYMWGKV